MPGNAVFERAVSLLIVRRAALPLMQRQSIIAS
jgi:hypothetical protein